MNFKGIEKKEAGKFITRYDITYETVDNQKKVYEIISRKKDMETLAKYRNIRYTINCCDMIAMKREVAASE